MKWAWGLVTWLLTIIVSYLSLSLAGGALLVDRALHRPRFPTTSEDDSRATALARTLGARLETVQIVASDGALQRAWLFEPGRPNGHSIVLLHGITSNRASLLTHVGMFVERGYRALAVDARAHGDSGGALGTFGLLEADDLTRWIARMRRGATDGCVYVFGQSLGAALALQASNTPGLCAAVAESGFASLHEIGFDRIGQQLHTGPWVGRTLFRPALELGFLYARIRHGLDLNAASSVAAAALPGVPVLLIHGTEDVNTPARHAQLIHDANPGRVTLWLVPGGAHDSIMRAAPDEYRERIITFLETHRLAITYR